MKKALIIVIVAAFLLQIGLAKADVCYGTTDNYTTNYNPPSNPAVGSDGVIRGERIKVGANDINLTFAQKFSLGVGTEWIIATNSTIVARSPLSGSVSSFSVILSANTEYNVWFNDSVTWSMDTGVSNYPKDSTYGYSFISAVQCNNPSAFPNCVNSQDINLWINVFALGTQEQITCQVPTLTTLLLNGSESNITLDNATQLNATAFTNTTGLDVNISINGALSGLNQNITYLSEGLYNITAEWIGNATYAESNGTWWATLIFTPPTNYTSPYPLNTSWNWCVSNNTLLNHQAVFSNGTFISSNDSYAICPNGCSDDSCSLSPLMSALYSLAVIISIIIGLVLFNKFTGG